MNNQLLNHTWPQMKAAVREFWPHLSEDDVSAMAGERDELMRRLKARQPRKTYAEIEREVTEFELRDVRAAYAARPSFGITNDWTPHGGPGVADSSAAHSPTPTPSFYE